MSDKKISSLDLARAAREALLDKKGLDITILDVRGISDVTDFHVIATGNNNPHLKAMMNECEHVLGSQRGRSYRHAGKPESGWLVADYWDVVVHVFSEEARRYYAFENLWRDARRIE
jgi:ribosome-associated protein